MRKLSVFILLTGLVLSSYAQENVTVPDTSKKKAEEKVINPEKKDSVVVKVGGKEVILSGDAEEAKVVEQKEKKKPEEEKHEKGKNLYKEEYNGDKYKVIVGSEDNPIMQYIEGDDTIVIRMRRKGIRIIETPDGSTIRITKDYNLPEKKNKRKRFKGNWQGFEIGMNNYLTPDFRFPNGFLEVYDGKAWNLNFNLLQYSMGVSHSGKVGFVTGLGLRLNNYKLTGNNSITKDSTGYIVELPYEQDLKMSKIYTCYLTAPLLFEIQTGRWFGKGFRMGFGVIGSLKLQSYTKVKWYENGNKSKNKIKGDFNISPLDVATTLRIGVNGVDMFANYSLIPLFQKDQGPEVYPIAVGLGFRF